MSVSYLDVFLAFLGMTFGLPSVLPGLFFQPKAEPPRTSQATSTDAGPTATDDDVTAT
ncbi:hypothetical protein ACT4MK_16680 [Bradyrhizobium barranii]|jgi:hypothetical protein|uniref:Uncharacterized protein n=1 Tax=Bradyrhizobium barranii subsp. apii TaxID=2819348 RepID=A0A8T5VAN2_9BRAD|nr:MULTISPECIES: hypothetical protein [Bradyrhizobium]MCK1279535.1 hypothetical protein [Bradyrhizobium sp. 61]MCK1445933.1 hypothetical protein [Bradyrhizobium sp. 48]MCK1461044.1 hypothetical protein [Bradyrhizobium sp. 2]UPT83918.1 hypothetical protein HAP41_0000026315 [Bradyrhizobium barranii subsp. apii]UPT93051.1 hypothetical protein J4G48_0026940 [Bradyrhizobium barranii subsp. apii]